jgi:hypothetical protein
LVTRASGGWFGWLRAAGAGKPVPNNRSGGWFCFAVLNDPTATLGSKGFGLPLLRNKPISPTEASI